MEPTPLTFYIIFHKLLFARNTKDFTEDERHDWFRWYAVNEEIPKTIPDWVPNECLVEEYKLKKYDPDQQRNKSYQNSCFFHLYYNPAIVTTKYIGFGQYDMSMDVNTFRMAVDIMKKENTAFFVMYPYNFIHLFNLFSDEIWNKHFVYHYNKYYNTNHTLDNIKNIPLALLHTFILPTSFFMEMMKFTEHIHTHIWTMLNFDSRHYAGTMERVFALYINFAIYEKRLTNVLNLQGFSHNQSQHMGDEMRGIQKGREA